MNKTCDKCTTLIPHGNPYICIAHNIEQMQTDIATQQNYVNVLSSEEALILCGNCARHFTAKAMKTIIKTMPISKTQILAN